MPLMQEEAKTDDFVKSKRNRGHFSSLKSILLDPALEPIRPSNCAFAHG